MKHAVTYELIKKDSMTRARRGVLHTPHGDIQTPVFMPVGTQATVKAMRPEAGKGDGGGDNPFQHLPPVPAVPAMRSYREAGGLHRFMNWDRAILTDSGGFQVFSLGSSKKDNRRRGQSSGPISTGQPT